MRSVLQQFTAVGRTEFDNSVDEQYYRIAGYITDLSFWVSEKITEKKKNLSYPKIDQIIFDIKKLTQHWAQPESNCFDFIISFNSTYIQQLSQFDLTIYKNCINVILAYAKTDSNNLNAKATDLAIYLLEQIKLFDNQNNEDVLKAINNLTEFIEYRSNRKSDYKFPENRVLAAFICNIIKHNSIDEFTSLIQSNRIENLEIAYSFWATFNGFANLPKNLTDIVLENENEQLLNYIDSYLFYNYLNYN